MLTRWTNWGPYTYDRELERSLAEFDSLRREMNRLFEGDRRQRGGLAGWPRIELFDEGNQLVVRAEVPGLSEEDLKISVDQGVLTIAGERHVAPPEGYSAHRQERGSYRFSRSFTLPRKVDAEKTTAKLAHGVLSLTLPKAAEEQPRQIPVSAK
jgi:HSP20 family protein